MSDARLASLELRLRLGGDALLSLEEAAFLLPVPPEPGRTWIDGHVKATLIAGVPIVRWADVLRAVDAAGAAEKGGAGAARTGSAPRWLSTEEAANLLGVNRKTLDGLARGNLDIPGGPVLLGGGRRLHLRWPSTGLDTWLTAVRARATAPVKAAGRRAPPRPAKPIDDGPVDWAEVRRRLLKT